MEVSERQCVQKQPHKADDLKKIASVVMRITADNLSRVWFNCQFSNMYELIIESIFMPYLKTLVERRVIFIG
jgi:hypothetical protein